MPKRSGWKATGKENSAHFLSRVKHYTEQLKQYGLEQTLDDLRHYVREGIGALEQNLTNRPSGNREPRGLTQDEINITAEDVASDEETLMQSAETVGRKLAQLEQGINPSSPIDRDTPWDWQLRKLYEEDFVSDSEDSDLDEDLPDTSDEDDNGAYDVGTEDNDELNNGQGGDAGEGGDVGDQNLNEKPSDVNQQDDRAAKSPPQDTGKAKSPVNSPRKRQSSNSAGSRGAALESNAAAPGDKLSPPSSRKRKHSATLGDTKLISKSASNNLLRSNTD